MYFLVEYDAYSSLNISTYYILQLYHSDGKGFASAASHYGKAPQLTAEVLCVWCLDCHEMYLVSL